jgi:hypothetical protein
MPSVYIETTIPSYLTAGPSRDLVVAGHQQITHTWWQMARDRFDLFISEAVLLEVRAGDPEFAARRVEPRCRKIHSVVAHSRGALVRGRRERRRRMIHDPIVEETRRVREGLLAKFGGNLGKYVDHLIEEQAKHPDRLVTKEEVLRRGRRTEGK